MYLKSKSKKIILRFNTPVSPVLHCYSTEVGPPGTHRKAQLWPWRGGLWVLPLQAFPPRFLPVLKKHYSIFTSESWLVLVCFFGTINKRSDFFLLFWLRPIYQSGYSFLQFSSTQADLAKWTYQCMHSDRILLPKWNVGICYAPQVEKWPRNQDLKGDI